MPQIPFFAKEWREYRGLEIKAASRLSGLKLSHLTAVESREHHFDEHDLVALANAYDINPVYLLDLNPSDPDDLKLLEEALAENADETDAEGDAD